MCFMQEFTLQMPYHNYISGMVTTHCLFFIFYFEFLNYVVQFHTDWDFPQIPPHTFFPFYYSNIVLHKE